MSESNATGSPWPATGATPGGGPAGPRGARVGTATEGPPAGTDAASASSGAVAAAADDGTARRRPPVWLLALLALLVVGAVVAGVLLSRDAPAAAPAASAPPAEVVTLPYPTPTIAPVAEPTGTPFLDALPATVLAYALTEQAAEPALLASGALEGHRLVYGDGGGTTLTLRAGQWQDAAAAEVVLDAAIAAVVPAADPAPEQGTVDAAGALVGRSLLLPRADGTATVWWTNGTALLQLDGPVDAVRDVFTGFPL